MIEMGIMALPFGGKCIIETDPSYAGALRNACAFPTYRMLSLPEPDDAAVCEHGRRFQERLDDGEFLFWSVYWSSDAYSGSAEALEVPQLACGGYFVAAVELVSEQDNAGWGTCCRDMIASVGAHEFYGCEEYYDSDIAASGNPDELIQSTLFDILLTTVHGLV